MERERTMKNGNHTNLNKLFALLGSAVLLSACSFSDSSQSSSDSSGSISDITSSPFVSLSNSSLTDKQRYQNSVRDYTAEYVVSSSDDLESFRVRVGKLAEKYGITNWEEDKTTYLSIGKGLRKADLSKPQYEAFRKSFADSDPKKEQYIEEGFR